MKTFSHSGDLGDAIHFLPVMREMGGGKLVFTARAKTRQNLLQDDKWQVIQSLLEAQPYIDSVSADNNVKEDVNGDLFRNLFFTAMRRDYNRAKFVNLATWHALAHGVNPAGQDKAWLDVDPNPVSKFVFNRSFRYHNPEFPWQLIYDAFGKDAVFLGMEDEYQQFVTNYGPLPFLETPNLLDAARIIKGCNWFVGNQSCLYAIAEGMKHNAMLEVWQGNPNCLFSRPNVKQIWNFEHGAKAIKEIQETP